MEVAQKNLEHFLHMRNRMQSRYYNIFPELQQCNVFGTLKKSLKFHETKIKLYTCTIQIKEMAATNIYMNVFALKIVLKRLILFYKIGEKLSRDKKIATSLCWYKSVSWPEKNGKKFHNY